MIGIFTVLVVLGAVSGGIAVQDTVRFRVTWEVTAGTHATGDSSVRSPAW